MIIDPRKNLSTALGVSSLISEKVPSISASTCSYYGRVNTTGFGFIRSYEGIPENILVNLIVTAILLFIFVYLRRRFSDTKVIPEGSGISAVLYGKSKSSKKPHQSTNPSFFHRYFVTQWIWIRDLFQITDWDVYQNCSPDAYYYLLFHTYLILYLLFVTIFSCAIILPVNFQGTQGSKEQKFAHTTIANLTPDSPLLWVHALASIIYSLAGIIVAYLYTNATRYYAKEDLASRTLMIRGIPSNACDEQKLEVYFREAYPTIELTHLTLVYNIALLQHVYKRRELNLRIWQESKTMLDKSGERPIVYNNKCGQICGCCAKEIDAIDYYERLCKVYKERVKYEYDHVRQKKCNLAFVTLANVDQALKIRSDFSATCCSRDRRPTTSTSKLLSIHEWRITFAPSPKNIIWKNIPMSEASHWFRVIIVNVILVFFMIFLTTPSIVMSTIDKLANKYRSIGAVKLVTKQIHFPVVITSILPVLLLRIFAAAMPSLVSITSLLEKHWKKSALDKSMMTKLFLFLSMMILILPSLGLTSIEGFLRWVFESEDGLMNSNRIRWMCVFLPDNGAFFVNYIITSTFIGEAIELLRLADLVFYVYIILTAKSTAERGVIRHALQFPFRFGVQYAWTSAVFCVILAYSITCPLITPIGLIFMIFHRAVDKYNLVFVYDTEIADKSVHRLAGNFIIIALLIQQLTLLFFVLVRSETLNYLSMTLLASFILTSGIYMGFSCFDCCGRWNSRRLSSNNSVVHEKLDTFEDKTCKPTISNYIPTVLNSCIEEFDLSPSRTKIHKNEKTSINEPVIVGTDDENDLFTD